MSQTMSNPNDWAHFYHHHNHNNQLNFSPSSGGGAAAITTTSTVTSSSADPTSTQLTGSGRGSHHNSSSVANSLSPEGGRVAKPARRRSRASRRTPTTLLNTDTSNFRAMVQQFTGGPAGPFVTGGGSSLNGPPAGFSFGLSPLGQQHNQLIGGDRIPNAAAAATLSGGEGLFHHLQYQQQQFHQPSPFMFSLGNGDDPTNINNISDGISGEHLLVQRAEGGASMAGGDGTTTAAAPPSSAGSNNENRNSGFLY